MILKRIYLKARDACAPALGRLSSAVFVLSLQLRAENAERSAVKAALAAGVSLHQMQARAENAEKSGKSLKTDVYSTSACTVTSHMYRV